MNDAMTQPERTVTIDHAAFGSGFDVTVTPAPDGDSLDREWPTHAEARGYARGLKLYKGYSLVDRTNGGAA